LSSSLHERADLVLEQHQLPGEHTGGHDRAPFPDIGGQRLLVVQAGAHPDKAADLHGLGRIFREKRVEHAPGQIAVAHHEQRPHRTADPRGHVVDLAPQPEREVVQRRADDVVPDDIGRVVAVAHGHARAMRLAERAGGAYARIDDGGGDRLVPQALQGGRVELLEQRRMHAVADRRLEIGMRVVADVQNAVGRNAERLEHHVEQAASLGAAMGLRHEDMFEGVEQLGSGGRGDVLAQLRLGQVHVADDDDAEPAPPRIGDQVERGPVGEGVVALDRQLGRDGGGQLGLVGAWKERTVDLVEPDLQSAVPLLRDAAGDALGPTTRLDPAAGERKVGEDVARLMGVAPDQRVETVERQHLDTRRCPVEQRRQLVAADLQLHRSTPKTCGAGYRPRWLSTG
jgi:hypothetical protein